MPRKPSAFGGPDSHGSDRYSYLHNHFYGIQVALPLPFTSHRTLPYPGNPGEPESPAVASVMDLVPFIIGAGTLDQ